jgi:hypothetical protein
MNAITIQVLVSTRGVYTARAMGASGLLASASRATGGLDAVAAVGAKLGPALAAVVRVEDLTGGQLTATNRRAMARKGGAK